MGNSSASASNSSGSSLTQTATLTWVAFRRLKISQGSKDMDSFPTSGTGPLPVESGTSRYHTKKSGSASGSFTALAMENSTFIPELRSNAYSKPSGVDSLQSSSGGWFSVSSTTSGGIRQPGTCQRTTDSSGRSRAARMLEIMCKPCATYRPTPFRLGLATVSPYSGDFVIGMNHDAEDQGLVKISTHRSVPSPGTGRSSVGPLRAGAQCGFGCPCSAGEWRGCSLAGSAPSHRPV